MRTRVAIIAQRALPRGPVDLLRQIVLFCGAYWLYRLARGMVYDQTVSAFDHARNIIDLERSTHVFVEQSIQTWAIGTGFVNDLASWMYLNSHFVVTTCTLAFIYLFRNEHFYFVRNMFMVAMGLALVGYVVYPTAPPRMFPELGFVDSVANYTGVSESSVGTLFNPFAAVPSMHVCFALMLSIPMIRMSRHTWAKALWGVYAPAITFVVIATGNHWIFDAVTGALVAGVSAIAAQTLFARVRPQAWAWHPGLASPVRAG
jgi:membrane-associated phospholipid phosphatase